MGYQSAIQILKQADDLKAKLDGKQRDLLVDSDAWTDYRQLQSIYQQVLVTELEYALDKKVELDLWNVGFKSHINLLQDFARDKKNPRRSDYQALLTWCLETASGYYLTLLQELCNKFDIDLPFRRRSNVFGQLDDTPDQQAPSPQTSSCLYICQYCLVHLGDIARYRNQRKQAENFYKQAIIVSPTSGHPYNQLALLEASHGNKLSTVYYYVRAIAVKNPFPASTTNLTSTLNAIIEKNVQLEKIAAKMTVSEFINLFLCTHGRLQMAIELSQAEMGVKSLNANMTPLVATHSLTTENLLQITTINLYALRMLDNVSELTVDEKIVRNLLLDLVAGSMTAFLVPVYTLKLDDSLLDYYALPSVKLLMYFIKNRPDILEESVFRNKLQIWPSLCKLVNNVYKQLKTLNYNKYINVPLYEDVYLLGFLEFVNNFEAFDFNNITELDKMEKLIRLKRMVEFCMWLSELDTKGNKLIIKREENEEIIFESGCLQPDPTDDLLEELKSFTILISEKVTGILKPQGSLEKARDERPLSVTESNQSNSAIEVAKSKRSKQNVALQSIFKKMEENKQVKFNVEEMDGGKSEKSVKFDAILPSTSAQNQFQHSFNRFPPPPCPPPVQPDYPNSYLKPTTYNYPNNDMNPQFMDNQYNYPQNQYTNRQFPYSDWKPEELSMPKWWNPQQNRPNDRSFPSYIPSMMENVGEQHSVWGNFPPRMQNNFPSDHFEGPAMSVRQAMLKEVSTPADVMKSRQNVQQQPISGGYSLFNANSWSPNLAGQLQNPKNTQPAPPPLERSVLNGAQQQQSLFSGQQSMQSLAQLVEQQNQSTLTKK